MLTAPRKSPPGVERMAELWAVEAKVKGQDPQTRLNERRRVSAPIILELVVREERISRDDGMIF